MRVVSLTNRVPSPPVSALAAEFKQAFAGHPAGVAVVSAATSSGPAGLTVSSVASVGLAPVALSFSVTQSTGSAGLILAADSYAVQLLDLHHADIAGEFARPGGERFTPEQNWTTLPTGEPVLAGARAAMRCKTLHTVPVGPSTLVIAEVLDIVTADAGDPLVYLNRTFGTVQRSR